MHIDLLSNDSGTVGVEYPAISWSWHGKHFKLSLHALLSVKSSMCRPTGFDSFSLQPVQCSVVWTNTTFPGMMLELFNYRLCDLRDYVSYIKHAIQFNVSSHLVLYIGLLLHSNIYQKIWIEIWALKCCRLEKNRYFYYLILIVITKELLQQQKKKNIYHNYKQDFYGHTHFRFHTLHWLRHRSNSNSIGCHIVNTQTIWFSGCIKLHLARPRKTGSFKNASGNWTRHFTKPNKLRALSINNVINAFYFLNLRPTDKTRRLICAAERHECVLIPLLWKSRPDVVWAVTPRVSSWLMWTGKRCWVRSVLLSTKSSWKPQILCPKRRRTCRGRHAPERCWFPSRERNQTKFLRCSSHRWMSVAG